MLMFFMSFYTHPLGLFIPSGWVALYPAAGYHPTQLLGIILPSGWVVTYPTAGYERTYSLGTISIILSIKLPPSTKYRICIYLPLSR